MNPQTVICEPNRSSESQHSRLSPNRERNIPRRWSAPIQAYPEGPPATPEEELHAVLDADEIPARALAAADDVLAPLFDNPRVRLVVRTVGKRALSTKSSSSLKESFNGAFKAGLGYINGKANSFTKRMQSRGFISRSAEDATAFSNLTLRYVCLKHSTRVKLSHTLMGDKVEACIVATSRIRRGTLILELGGLMSADAIKKGNLGSPGQPGSISGKYDDGQDQSALQTFSVVWKGKGQSGPGPKEDRLLLGPVRFVNHSCTPNCKLRAYPRTNAWGVEATRDITLDEELTVNYGKNYFDPGECACTSCKSKGTGTVRTPATSIASTPSPSPSPFEPTELRSERKPSRKRQLWEQETTNNAPGSRKKVRR